MQTQIKEHKNFHIGISLARRGQYMEALARLSSLAKENPQKLPEILIPLYILLREKEDAPQLRIVITQLYIEHKRFTEAFLELEDLTEQHPFFTQSYFLLYKLYNKNVFKLKIEEIFESAFKQGVYDSTVTDLLSKIYIQKDETQKSIAFFETLKQKKEDNIQYPKSLTELYIQTKDYKNAYKTLKHWMTLCPDDAKIGIEKCEKLLIDAPHHHYLKELLIDLYLQVFNVEKAHYYLQDLLKKDQKSIDTVISKYKKAVEKFPENSLILMGLCDSYCAKGYYTDAVETLKGLLEKNTSSKETLIQKLTLILSAVPTHAYALQLLTECYLQTKNTDKALETIAISLDQTHYDEVAILSQLEKIKEKNEIKNDKLHYNFAKLYFKNNHIEKSLEHSFQLKDGPLEQEGLCLEHQLHTKNNEEKEKERIEKELVKKFPYHTETHQILKASLKNHTARYNTPSTEIEILANVQLHLKKGNLDHVIKELQKIPENSPIELLSHCLILRCFIEKGLPHLGINSLENLIEKENPNTKTNEILSAHFLLALAYYMTENTQQALKQIYTLIEKQLNYPKALALLETININKTTKNGTKEIIGIFNKNTNEFIPTQFVTQNTPLSNEVAQEQNNNGIEEFKKKNIKKAKEEFKKALETETENQNIKNNLALCYIVENQLEKARTLLCKENANSLYIQSISYYAEENIQKAFESIENALQTKKAETYLILQGDLAYQIGEFKNAQENWINANKTGLLSPHIQRRTHLLNIKNSIHHWITPNGFWESPFTKEPE